MCYDALWLNGESASPAQLRVCLPHRSRLEALDDLIGHQQRGQREGIVLVHHGSSSSTPGVLLLSSCCGPDTAAACAQPDQPRLQTAPTTRFECATCTIPGCGVLVCLVWRVQIKLADCCCAHKAHSISSIQQPNHSLRFIFHIFYFSNTSLFHAVA